MRGPVVLARDKRLGGAIHEDVEIEADAGGYVPLTPAKLTVPALMQFTVAKKDGGTFVVIDFASSGNTWDAQSERMTWIPRPGPPAPHWIWFPEAGNPASQAPVGKRWFRRVIEIPTGRKIKRATATMTADNQFTLYVNGQVVGSGDAWQKPVAMDVEAALRADPVVLAVEAVNTEYNGPNAAGLLGRMEVEFVEGSPLLVFTDKSWKSFDEEVAGWQNSGFNEAGWKPAQVLGRNGAKPWRALREFED